jgi:hypothetical protein
LDLPPSVISV